MNDDRACPSYRDADMIHVDVGDPYAVRWWCQRFVCTESMLRGAVAAVGCFPHHVERYLRDGSRPARSRSRVSRRRVPELRDQAS